MIAHNCVNYDETQLFVVSNEKMQLKHVDKNRNELLSGKDELIGLFVTFVSANSVVLILCYVLKGKKSQEKGFKRLVEVEFLIIWVSLILFMVFCFF